MDILYSDNRIIVCLKPTGVVSTDEPGGLPSLLRAELGDAHACVRTVHRLDQVVGGVMVLARSREAARRLSAQVESHQFRKEYLAVLEGMPAEKEGCLRDLLRRDKAQKKTFITDTPGKDSREAVLHYRLLDSRGGLSLVRIRLETGRPHQIRAQFSGRGLPLAGDRKYGAQLDLGNSIALWSRLLSFRHPQTNEVVTFAALPQRTFPWDTFPCLWNDSADWSELP